MLFDFGRISISLMKFGGRIAVCFVSDNHVKMHCSNSHEGNFLHPLFTHKIIINFNLLS